MIFIAVQDPLTSLTFQVTLWSSLTEKLKNSIACKRHVTEYLRDFATYSERWLVPHNVLPDNSGVSCPVLNFVSPGAATNMQATCLKSSDT